MTQLADRLLRAAGNLSQAPQLVSLGAIGGFTPTFGQPTSAGNLLICWVGSNDGGGSQPNVTGSGWTSAITGGGGYDTVEILYKANCAANESSPSFSSGASTVISQLAEFSSVATSSPLISTGSGYGTVSNAASDMTDNALLVAMSQWNTANTPTSLNSSATDSNGSSITLGTSDNLGGTGVIFLSAYGVCDNSGAGTDSFTASENVFPGDGAVVLASFAAA